MINQKLSIPSVLLFLLLSACAAKQTVVTVIPGGGEKAVLIEVSSFSFVPTVVQATRGDHLVLKVTNLAGSTHNLSVRNPRGVLVISRDLAVGEFVEIPLELTEEGTWPYFCDKPFHESLGMKGSIEAASAP